MFTYVTNNCLSQILYSHSEIAYDQPLIGTLFLNDSMYVKLCSNFNHYIHTTPVFTNTPSKRYIHAEILPNYPVMLLEDIEIHWIHEHNTDDIVSKFNRRVKRYDAKITQNLYILCHSDIMEDHTESDYKTMVENFTSIQNSVYLTKFLKDTFISDNVFFVKEWVNESLERDSSGIYVYHHLSYREKYVKEILEIMKRSIDTKYSMIMPLKINELNSFKIFSSISIDLYAKFLDTLFLKNFIIICPLDDMPQIKKHTDKYSNIIQFEFIDENLLLEDIEVKGWYKQQLIKLLVANHVETSNYLIVDSDMYLNQHLKYADLFDDKLIKYSFEEYHTTNDMYHSTNSNWWESSANIVDFNINFIRESIDLMGVTPQLMIKDVVIELINFLTNRYGNQWKKTICQLKFTEYTLYWLYLLKNRYNLFYTPNNDIWKHDLSTNILHHHTVDEQQQKIKASLDNNTTKFSVIQSYLPVDIDMIIKTVHAIHPIKYDAIFLVSSSIKPTVQKFFSVEERFNQTLDTIRSIRKKVPKSYIILIDGSSNISKEHFETLNNMVDKILYLGQDDDVKNCVNFVNIGVGEQQLLYKGFNYIKLHNLHLSCDRVFKLGARYVLTDDFNIDKYSKTNYTFFEEFERFDHKDISLNVYTTGLYSIPCLKVDEFMNTLKNYVDIRSESLMIEKYFYEKLCDVHKIELLGLEGRLSYNGYKFRK